MPPTADIQISLTDETIKLLKALRSWQASVLAFCIFQFIFDVVVLVHLIVKKV